MPRTNAGIPAIVTRLENSKSLRRAGKKPLRPPVRAAGAVRAKAKRMDRHLLAIERRLKLENDDERIDLARILDVTA